MLAPQTQEQVLHKSSQQLMVRQPLSQCLGSFLQPGPLGLLGVNNGDRVWGCALALFFFCENNVRDNLGRLLCDICPVRSELASHSPAGVSFGVLLLTCETWLPALCAVGAPPHSKTTAAH